MVERMGTLVPGPDTRGLARAARARPHSYQTRAARARPHSYDPISPLPYSGHAGGVVLKILSHAVPARPEND